MAEGLLTGKQQFRISRRIEDAQGRFAGVVFIPMKPMDFTAPIPKDFTVLEKWLAKAYGERRFTEDAR